MSRSVWLIALGLVVACAGGPPPDLPPEPFCGDYRIDPGEECDDGAANNGDDRRCTSECLNARCGDGLVAPDESCDDMNENPSDGCNACRFPGDVVGARQTRAGDVVATDRVYLKHAGTGPGTWIEVQAFDGASIVDLQSDFTGSSYVSNSGAMAVEPTGHVVATHARDATNTYETGTHGSVARFSPDGTLLWSTPLEPLDPGDTMSAADIEVAGARIAIGGLLQHIVRVYAGGYVDFENNGLVRLLDASGNILWTDTFDADGRLYTWVWRVTVDADGFTCAGGAAGPDEAIVYWLRCYDSSGVLAWHIGVPGLIYELELRGDELIAITENAIVTRSRLDGTELSSVPLAAPFVPYDIEIEGDRAILLSVGNLAVFGLDGVELWRSSPDQLSDLPVLGASIGQDGRLYAIHNGGLLWFEPQLP